MTRCTPEFLDQAASIVGHDHLKTDPRILQSGSRDCFHFSPVLTPQLEDCRAEAIAFPATEKELAELMATAVAARVPLTPRGGGTGNYGQGVPLTGGLMINTRRMDRILAMDGESACVEAGTRLWTIEKNAAEFGAELRIFPSTIATSSAAGFIAGGSGGVGSIEWGMLRDCDNVRHARILTAEHAPRTIDLNGMDQLQDVLHNCGQTAFITRVTFALAPKTRWQQYIYAFDDFELALEAGMSIAGDESRKRLVTAFEWPLPACFLPLAKRGACPDGKALLFVITDRDPLHLDRTLQPFRGSRTFHLAPGNGGGSGKGLQIYEFAWNHTTQWAMKSNPRLTYLQEGFDPQQLLTQIRARKARFGDQVSSHIEFIRDPACGIRPAGLSVVEYRGKDQLWELIDFCEQHDIRIANPHTHFLDDDTRWYGDNLLAAKKRWDPDSLLNPGHLRMLES